MSKYTYIITTDGAGHYFANTTTPGLNNVSGTDASTVFNTAISSLTNGGSVYVDAGTYILTESIKMNRNNVALHGAGKATVISQPNDKNAIYVSNPGIDLVHDIIIDNLRIIGSKIRKDTNILIMIAYATHIVVQNCTLDDCGFHTIFAVETDYSLFNHNYVTNSFFDAIALAQGSDYNIVSNNVVTGVQNDCNGIDVNGGAKASSYNWIVNNVVHHCRGGICFDTADHGTIQNNIISYVELGIDITGQGGNTSTSDNKILNNNISHGVGTRGWSTGIQLSTKSDRNVIVDNEISYFTEQRSIIINGITNTIRNNYVHDGVNGLVMGAVSGNTITNNNFANLNVGIILHNGTTNTEAVNVYLNVTTPVQWV
jgi:parallel beta-helix repeat protein